MNISQEFEFNKKLGQNFIMDKGFLASVVSKTNAMNNDVLEIGPGAGTLTKEIAKVANNVITIEIDKRLEPILNEALAEFKNVKVVFDDALKMSTERIEECFKGEYVLVANLPYYITTPLIFKFLESSKCKQINVMVQKEVGERIISKPGTKDYGALTVSIGAVATAKVIANAPRNLFTPRPNVDSVVICITKENKFKIKDKKTFDKLVKCAFENRRKIFVSNISNAFNIAKEKCVELLETLGHNPMIRGEALTVEQFVQLSNLI